MTPYVDFFTMKALGTLVGANAAVLVVTNTIRIATKWRGPVLPLVISASIVLIADFYNKLYGTPGRWFLAPLNILLLFSTAAGIQETGAYLKWRLFNSDRTDRFQARADAEKRVEWWSSWFKTN